MRPISEGIRGIFAQTVMLFHKYRREIADGDSKEIERELTDALTRDASQ